jgi:DNA-binding Lrp family transcriptional regulator
MSKNKQLLSALRSNSRTSIVKLAKQTNTPATTLYSTLSKAEKNMIIKHSTLINFEALGFHRYIFIIKNDSNMIPLTRWLSIYPEANNIYRIDAGLLIEMVFKDEHGLNAFIRRLQGEHTSFQYHPIEEVLKQEASEI